MIFGILTKERPAKEYLHKELLLVPGQPVPDGRILLLQCGQGQSTLGEHFLFEGDLWASSPKPSIEHYREEGWSFVNRLRGRFALSAYLVKEDRLLLAVDHLGQQALYIRENDHYLAWSTDPSTLLRFLDISPELSMTALTSYLLLNYIPGPDSLYCGVRKLRPGHVLELQDGRRNEKRYWRPSFLPKWSCSEANLAEALTERVKTAVVNATDGVDRPGVLLSGGIDSSTIAALASESAEGLSTYSYRCKGATFDESRYSTLMSRAISSRHTERLWEAKDVEKSAALANAMEEPFCDIGVHLAAFQLAKEAASDTPVLLAGYGPDELFGSHPFYEADKVAGLLSGYPLLLKLLRTLGPWLPDVESKQSLLVKVKRFAEGVGFPPDLLSQRWRLCWSADELSSLLMPEWNASSLWQSAVDSIIIQNRGDESLSLLESCVRADLQTLVGTYLSQGRAINRRGVSVRYPYLDPDLVGFCCRLPEKLKVRGWFSPKYLFHRAVKPLIPTQISEREDKLGNSIPLKNWLRDEPSVITFFREVLSEEQLKRRGLFRPEAVDKLFREHQARRRNNSHRLWSLVMLELWMATRI